jgi:iron complex outermembrane receptor protein
VDRPIDGPVFSIYPDHMNEYVYNGFVQDQITIVPDRLQWTVGTKLEYNNLTNLEVEPSMRLLWTPDERNSIWMAASRSTRVPSMYEESYVESQGALLLGSDKPGAETTNSYEIGYKVQPVKPLTFDATGFFNQYSGLIEDVPNIFAVPQEDSSNAVDARSYGGEVSANWQVTDRLRLAASYSYLMTRAQARTSSINNFFIPLSELELVEGGSPRNQFQIHCYLDLLKNLQLNTSLYYYDALTDINEATTTGNVQKVPSYFRLDMNLRWEVRPNMSLAVGVQNILQDRHYEAGTITFNTAAPTEVPRTFFAEWTMKM